MAEISIKGKLAIELLTNYPNAYTKTLAKIAIQKYPEVFKDEESARGVIRWHRGAKGKASRKNALKPREFTPELFNPFSLPSSDEIEYLPYTLPNDCKNILILSDIHVPYHNLEALTLAIRYGLDHQVDTIFLNGDFMDFYSLSRYEKDPRKRDFVGELEMGRQILKRLRELFPNARMYYLQGNHDLRLEVYLKVKAPELFGIEDFELNNLLRFGEMNIEYIKDKRIVKAGKLNILHGHELKGGAFSPVNVARGLYMKTKTSSICGHHHSTSEHTETSINGDVFTCWSVGHLGEEHPNYMPLNKWNHGFARVDVKEDGNFTVHNKRIVKGQIY